MVGLAFATLIAAALEAREDGLELGTVRPIGVFDAGLVLVLSALAAVGLAAGYWPAAETPTSAPPRCPNPCSHPRPDSTHKHPRTFRKM